jgi:2-keto-4-pentenoate hydratase/2-oxohepta-3-ene-1,7-dioic acid hydratase in catechol pathway
VIEVGGRHFDLAEVAPDIIRNPVNGLLDVFDSWDRNETHLVELASRLASGELTASEILAPADSEFGRLLSFPPKMIFAGLNYHDHLRKDLGITDFDKSAVDPLFFLKQRGSLGASGQDIEFPSQTRELDWEVELVVIIGRPGRYLKARDAMDHVAGYAVGLDLSARDWQMSKRHMRQFDLFGGKAFDDSSPVGPKFIPATSIAPDALSLRLWVNGELKQDSNTREMIWSIPEMIEAITLHMAIEPGDMLFTGSPAGVGLVKGTYLNPGDEIRAEVGGVGTLTTRLTTPAIAR